MRGRDLTGQSFGRLLVVGSNPNRHENGSLLWNCWCSCGEEKLAQSGNLLSGSVRSCGCLKSEVASATAKITNAKQKGKKRPSVTKPGAAFRMLYRSYKKDAQARGYSFNLSEDRVRMLTSGSCHYCGTLPSKYKTAWSGEVYTYNGIDRLHNNIGYEEGNCVSCCTRCNLFKGSRDQEEFLAMVNIIFCHSISGVVDAFRSDN